MNIQITARHIDLTDGIRDAISDNFDKVFSRYPAESASVTFVVESQETRVEVVANYLRAQIPVQAKDGDPYAAISSAAVKLEKALAKRKGARNSNLRAKPVLVEDLVE